MLFRSVVPLEGAGGDAAPRGDAKETTTTPVESPAPSAVPSRQPSATPSVASKAPVPSGSSAKPPAPFKPPSTPSQAQTLDARAKSRAKKKTGLQDMLARNRERQEKEKKAGAGTGLAAFLQDL